MKRLEEVTVPSMFTIGKYVAGAPETMFKGEVCLREPVEVMVKELPPVKVIKELLVTKPGPVRVTEVPSPTMLITPWR